MLSVGTRFWINVVGRILPLLVSFLFAIFSTDERIKYVVFAAAIVALTLVEYFGIYRPSRHFEDVIKEQLDFFFEPFLRDAKVGTTNADLRVNIMLVRWTYRGRHFCQYYQKGMQGSRDASIHFSIKRGLCGVAFARKTHDVLYRDLRKDTSPIAKKKYKWSEKEFEMVKHIKAVATIPLYRQRKTIRGRWKNKYFGTLNFDAMNDAGVQFLADATVHERIKGFAQFVQISLD